MTRLGRNASLLEIIEHLGQADGEFAPSTVRQYFAALTWAVDEALECSVQSIEITNQCREALAQRPQPRPKDAEERTSARKRKRVAPQELYAVCMFLRKRRKAEDLLLLYLLINGVVVALRPSEYSDANVQGDLLVVRSKKTTNGRGLGTFRELDLASLPDGQMALLRRLIDDFGAAAAGDVERLIDRLGGRLRRVCTRLNIAPFALYTTRHQAIANMKAAGKTATEIAAVSGHRSLHTAGKAYSPRSSGWKTAITAGATLETMARVAATVLFRDVEDHSKRSVPCHRDANHLR